MSKPKEKTNTFKASEELTDLVSETAYDIDQNKSAVIRCCILLAIDTIKSNPSLVDRLQVTDRIGNNI